MIQLVEQVVAILLRACAVLPVALGVAVIVAALIVLARKLAS